MKAVTSRPHNLKVAGSNPAPAPNFTACENWLRGKLLNLFAKAVTSAINCSNCKVGDQLIIDKERYKRMVDCERLVCFVYDPDHRIANPAGLENDLSSESPLVTEVLILPKS